MAVAAIVTGCRVGASMLAGPQSTIGGPVTCTVTMQVPLAMSSSNTVSCRTYMPRVLAEKSVTGMLGAESTGIDPGGEERTCHWYPTTAMSSKPSPITVTGTPRVVLSGASGQMATGGPTIDSTSTSQLAVRPAPSRASKCIMKVPSTSGVMLIMLGSVPLMSRGEEPGGLLESIQLCSTMPSGLIALAISPWASLGAVYWVARPQSTTSPSGGPASTPASEPASSPPSSPCGVAPSAGGETSSARAGAAAGQRSQERKSKQSTHGRAPLVVAGTGLPPHLGVDRSEPPAAGRVALFRRVCS